MAQKENEFKITFVIPAILHQELRETIIRDGYGLRGKSLWISEAIDRLLQIETFPELVYISNEMFGFKKAETIVSNLSLKQKLAEAVIAVRKHYPSLEGVQSRIVRTTIVQRLLRG